MEVRTVGAGELIVEVVAVGTELLLGQIVNGNAAEIGARLADEGFNTHFQTVVGDNLPRIVSALEIAVGRSDAVVVTGGIGPTQDDLTREAICELVGVAMTRDADHAGWIDARLRAQGRDPTPSVFRMADLPAGAEGLLNPKGVALGVAIQHRGIWLFAIPGVPAEMIPMLELEVLPRLREVAGGPKVIRSVVLHCWGIGESSIADLLDDLYVSENPSLAFLIKDMEVRVRITAKADSAEMAFALIGPVAEEVRSRLGPIVFGTGDETVERLVLDSLTRAGWTIGTVEQATLGQVGARLAAVAGASCFAGSIVPGADPVLDPTADVLLHVGPIGPDPNPDVRTTRAVTMTVTTPLASVSRTFDFGGDDERLRSFATIAGLHLLRTALHPGPGE